MFYGPVSSSRCHNVRVFLSDKLFNLQLSLSDLSQVSLRPVSQLLAYFVEQTEPKLLLILLIY